MSDAEICPQCKEPKELVSECCDDKICKDCLDSSYHGTYCDGCEKALCDDCNVQKCQACIEEDDYSDVCKKCTRECVYCKRDYCPKHLLSTLIQVEPCKECGKQPCLDKKHTKEALQYVLGCFECLKEDTKQARKRKRYFAPVYEKKEQKK